MTEKVSLPIPERLSTPLLNCPFCGGVPWLACGEDVETTDPLFCVVCNECNFGLPWTDGSDLAVKAWNRRAVTPTPTDMREK